MPNIMLTYRCNLHCSYCFANEFVNKDKMDISISNFIKAVSFITKAKNENIGLIGGEPTLHPGFQTIMELLVANPRVSGVTLYTNGLLLDQYIPQINHPKVHILVNCNSPYIIGEKQFTHMQQNLDTLMWQYNMKDRIRLGINLYSDKMDYSYMMELLTRYEQHRVRISTTVPDFSTCGPINVLDHFSERKSFLLDFFKKMDSIHVMPFYDCNKPPYCIWTDEEKKWLEDYVSRYTSEETNIVGSHSKCVPVIDILPNLQAVRCFGMSDFMKVPISGFRNIFDLATFFMMEIDANAFKLAACDRCRNCREWLVHDCIPGCMGFKANRIHACNEAIDRS